MMRDSTGRAQFLADKLLRAKNDGSVFGSMLDYYLHHRKMPAVTADDPRRTQMEEDMTILALAGSAQEMELIMRGQKHHPGE